MQHFGEPKKVEKDLLLSLFNYADRCCIFLPKLYQVYFVPELFDLKIREGKHGDAPLGASEHKKVLLSLKKS
jgi:hypothetical protein